ncbi:UNVERIFIED_CONTAM: hypothetical protein GTU68_064865 [Idotea baltica]|nr:hypothetical protein [Idotea baltica]
MAYDGTEFHGWQRQSYHISIQEKVEEALSTILRRPIHIHGCGRTDAGVHADDYFAHINLLDHESEKKIVYRLNKILPTEILIRQLLPVQRDSNAQKDAISRTYRYNLHIRKDPFLSRTSTWIPDLKLDLKILSETAALLPLYRDFRNFCKTPDKHKSTHCQILRSEWSELDQNQLQFEISADHFLRGMIRLLVGNMLEVASRKISMPEFQSWLQLEGKPKHFQMAPPQGLHLTNVVYEGRTFPMLGRI